MTQRQRIPYRAPRTCCGGSEPVEYWLPESKASINQYGIDARCGECGQIRHLERDA